MIVLVAKYTVKKGLGDEVLRALEKMAPLVKAQEPGCALYQVCRSAENPDQFLLYEHYVDNASFAAHRQTPHFKELVEGTVLPLLEDRQREIYELVIE